MNTRLRIALLVGAVCFLVGGNWAWAQCGAGQMAVETITAACPNACTDGIDNDGNGFIDKLAYGVSGSLGPDEGCMIETRWGSNGTLLYNACNDGINNDGDFSDNSTAGNDLRAMLDATATATTYADPECTAEVLCQDGFDNDGDGYTDALPAGTPPGNVGPDPDCQCMRHLQDPITCTANDFTIAFTANPQELEDGCINTSDYAQITSLSASLTSANARRDDDTMWVNLEGATAMQYGKCMRQMLNPVRYSGTWPTPPAPVNPPGPYRSMEAQIADRDLCGDMEKKAVMIWQYPVHVTVPCTDNLVIPNSNGLVDLGQCGSWNQNDNDLCTNVGGALPGSPSKCQCQEVDTNVPAPNVRTVCTGSPGPPLVPGFTDPLWTDVAPIGTPYGFGDYATLYLSFTNTVTNCTAATMPIGAMDPFGRTRCGTVSFMRFQVGYNIGGVDADAWGDFTVYNGTSWVSIPACGSPVSSWATVSQSPLANSGVICNDTTNKRLIWAPKDPITQTGTSYPAFAVISPWTGTNRMTLPIRYTITAQGTSTRTIGLNAQIRWDQGLDTNSNSAISESEALTIGPWSKLQSCTECFCTTSFNTTPVTLASFGAERRGRFATVSWGTETEVGTVGYNILGKTADAWKKLNDALIPSRGVDTMEPQAYSEVLELPADVTVLAIEEVDVRGAAHRRGEFAIGTTSGTVIEREPVAWDGAQRQVDTAETERQSRARDAHAAGIAELAGRPLRAAEATSVRSQISKHGFAPIELKVERDGLYRVTYEDLKAAGFDLAGVAVKGLGLSAGGVEVPIHVSAAKTFGPGAYFEFLGRALDTLYTGTNVYRLRLDATKPARVTIDGAAPFGAAAPSYLATRSVERNRSYSYMVPLDDPWYDTLMFVTTAAQSFTFAFTVDNLVAGSPAALAIGLAGGSDYPANPDHHVLVSVNGVSVGESSFDGMTATSLSLSLPAGTLHEGANTLTLRLPADLGTPFDLVYLDRFEVTYPRSFNAAADALAFTAAGGRFDIGGFTAPAVVAYREQGSALVKLTGVSAAAGTAVVPGAAGAASYHVASEAGLLRPAIVAAQPLTDITGGRADYLVIAHSGFTGGLSRLVAAREAQGHTVRVVDVADVYAQFGNGIVGANAIRDYIAYAAAKMGAEYVLLVGGDTYDYRNFLGIDSVSLIPSLYVATGDLVRFAPSDSAYADVDGDGAPDLAIGRFPARTAADLDSLITKTLAYESKPYGRTAVFAADLTDPTANQPFKLASDTFIAKLPGGWPVEKAYLDDMLLDGARATLLAAINRGTALTNYVGHSGPDLWSFSGLFTLTDAATLLNAGMPTAVVQWGCWNTYYVSPRTETLANKLLLSGDRGAAAVLGATTLTEDVAENELGKLLMGRLAETGKPMGLAILEAKQELAKSQPGYGDVLLGWNLLGDPALVVQP